MFRINDSATVYMAELIAVDKAIDFTINHNKSPAKIISDTRSVLLALENSNNLDPFILTIKDKVNKFNDQVHLFWIKAHVGHIGNERADELAKQATNSPFIHLTTELNLHAIKKLIKKDISAEWQDRWSNSTKGREVFALLPEVNESRIQGNFFMNQIITGHGTIAAYQSRFFGRAPTCTCGNPLEDRNHMIYDCSQWDNIRLKYFPRNYKKAKIDLLIFNMKSRHGLKEITKHKFQTVLSSIEDDETQD
ncbi:uncharacterized protein CDAR_205741 [Caerostris darwini]|uniref:RNase H type-1 domain-containing protein n=1 Tax=Caerostris darwini TaxID=1538125 RepID=A0AAV4WW64_9ARAC|nr:uncharacterized protein CDAR_205741 [Caerostris darwini]